MSNFYFENRLDTPAALAASVLIGLAFGFWLERAGFGSSRKLAAIFYRVDFAVLKVMFTAIVTAAVGLYLLEATGVVDVRTLYRPETFLTPQIAGGLLFGAGFVLGGWCPGTALVGVAAGKIDALVFLAGSGVGSLAFAAAWPSLADFASSGARGVSTLPAVFGWSEGLVTTLVVALALIAFAAARRLTVRAAA